MTTAAIQVIIRWWFVFLLTRVCISETAEGHTEHSVPPDRSNSTSYLLRQSRWCILRCWPSPRLHHFLRPGLRRQQTSWAGGDGVLHQISSGLRHLLQASFLSKFWPLESSEHQPTPHLLHQSFQHGEASPASPQSRLLWCPDTAGESLHSGPSQLSHSHHFIPSRPSNNSSPSTHHHFNCYNHYEKYRF